MAQPRSRYIFGSLAWYPVLIVLGMLLAVFLAEREERRRGLPKDTIIDLALWLLPFGVLGARLYYVIFNWQLFAPDPLRILRIWEGGLAIYGGIIAGVLTILLFARARRLQPFTLTDCVVPGVALAQAIGRWGNYFNMEAYGPAVTEAGLQFFPYAVLIDEGGAQVWHQATFFYESMWNLLVFGVLWGLRKRLKRRGDLTCLYFLLYGTGRMLIEGLRTDSLMIGPLRVSQVLSGALVLAGIGHFALRRKGKAA